MNGTIDIKTPSDKLLCDEQPSSSSDELDKAIAYFGARIADYPHEWQRNFMREMILAAKQSRELREALTLAREQGYAGKKVNKK